MSDDKKRSGLGLFASGIVRFLGRVLLGQTKSSDSNSARLECLAEDGMGNSINVSVQLFGERCTIVPFIQPGAKLFVSGGALSLKTFSGQQGAQAQLVLTPEQLSLVESKSAAEARVGQTFAGAWSHYVQQLQGSNTMLSCEKAGGNWSKIEQRLLVKGAQAQTLWELPPSQPQPKPQRQAPPAPPTQTAPPPPPTQTQPQAYTPPAPQTQQAPPPPPPTQQAAPLPYTPPLDEEWEDGIPF